jgi:hypothetical protein
MTPPRAPGSSCGGCFLYETRGVCPAARAAYGLDTPVEVQRRAETLRLAIAEDAHAARDLFQLICRGAQGRAVDPSAAASIAALPPACESDLPNTVSKEAINVVSSRPG